MSRVAGREFFSRVAGFVAGRGFLTKIAGFFAGFFSRVLISCYAVLARGGEMYNIGSQTDQRRLDSCHVNFSTNQIALFFSDVALLTRLFPIGLNANWVAKGSSQ